MKPQLQAGGQCGGRSPPTDGARGKQPTIDKH